MPKPRKSAGTLFQVSPWQDRNEKRGDAAQPGEVDYTVVHEDLTKIDTTAKQPPRPDSGEQLQDQVVITWQSPVATADGGGWRTKVVEADDNDTSMLDVSRVLRSGEIPTVEDYTTATTLAPQEQKTPALALPPTSTKTCSLIGTAFLVLLGGPRIVGNFSLLDGDPSITYPLHGKEITSYRECTRDPEWSIVELHILNLPHRDLPRELVIVAERTGGDAMKLRSPVEWQGDEVEAFAKELQSGGEDDGVGNQIISTSSSNIDGLEMEFECHNLITDAAADEKLAIVMPGAVGMDAMINIGPMKLTWKTEV